MTKFRDAMRDTECAQCGRSVLGRWHDTSQKTCDSCKADKERRESHRGRINRGAEKDRAKRWQQGLQAHAEGASIREVAVMVGVSVSRVSQVLKQEELKRRSESARAHQAARSAREHAEAVARFQAYASSSRREQYDDALRRIREAKAA